MFGFQLINKKPFYFFKQGSQIGISYNDQKTMMGYAQVPHYHCGSAAELNPIVAQNMVAFFAQRNGVGIMSRLGCIHKSKATTLTCHIEQIFL